MNHKALVCAAAIFAAALVAPQLRAQAPTVYTVAKGDTVMGIAARLKYPSATENQMAYALIRANPRAASARTKDRVLPGTKLKIPDEATVLSYKPEDADKAVTNLRKGEERYQAALAAEDKGDMKTAVPAYIEAARFGHPLADLRLGQLYDRDASKTLPRDLQQSVAHYKKAREFGIEIKKQPKAVNVPAHGS